MYNENNLGLRQQLHKVSVLTFSSAETFFLNLTTCGLSVRKSNAPQVWQLSSQLHESYHYHIEGSGVVPVQ